MDSQNILNLNKNEFWLTFIAVHNQLRVETSYFMETGKNGKDVSIIIDTLRKLCDEGIYCDNVQASSDDH